MEREFNRKWIGEIDVEGLHINRGHTQRRDALQRGGHIWSGDIYEGGGLIW